MWCCLPGPECTNEAPTPLLAEQKQDWAKGRTAWFFAFEPGSKIYVWSCRIYAFSCLPCSFQALPAAFFTPYFTASQAAYQEYLLSTSRIGLSKREVRKSVHVCGIVLSLAFCCCCWWFSNASQSFVPVPKNPIYSRRIHKTDIKKIGSSTGSAPVFDSGRRGESRIPIGREEKSAGNCTIDDTNQTIIFCTNLNSPVVSKAK